MGVPAHVAARPTLTPSERPGSEFHRLEARARVLQRSVFVLVAIVAVVPPLLALLRDLAVVRERATEDARHVIQVAGGYVHDAALDSAGLQQALQRLVDESKVAVVRVYGSAGELLAGASQAPVAGLTSFIKSAVVSVPDDRGPIRAVEVGLNAADVFRRWSWVVGTHILVAVVLGLAFYRLPVRALRTTIRELEAAHRQMVHQDRLATLGEMYAALTHEVNNPLGVILARVRLLLSSARDTGLDAETVHDLEVIERHGNRIAEIVRSLLAFARKPDLSRCQTDLNDVVREVLQLVEKPLVKQGIRVATSLSDLPLPLLASPQHLQHVVLNLVNNARDAMPDGGTLVLRTMLLAHPPAAAIEVQDTGYGLAPWVKERLFEPFFTTKEAGKGTGLGLSVSYGIVHAHGGEIAADNASSGGALFRVTLPLERAGA